MGYRESTKYKSEKRLEEYVGRDKSDDGSSHRNDEEFDSIDLDKELLGTKSSQWRNDKLSLKMSNQAKAAEEAYLSPNNRMSPFSRKVTNNTDNTKEESMIKVSDLSNKMILAIKLKGYDLDSLPSSHFFATKSDDQDEPFEKNREKIKSNVGIEDISKASIGEKDKSVDNSNQHSEVESSELKQTADFFRPSPTDGEIKMKRFSFGKKNGNRRLQNYEENVRKIDWESRVKISPLKSDKKIAISKLPKVKVGFSFRYVRNLMYRNSMKRLNSRDSRTFI